EIAQPFQLIDQGSQLGIAHSELRHAPEDGTGAVKIAGLELYEPGRHMCLQAHLGSPRLELDVIRVLLKESTGERRCPRIVATRNRVLEVPLRGTPKVRRQGESNQDAHNGGKLP